METYNEIYERMKQRYIAESESDFDEASDIAIKMRVLAGEIYNAKVNFEWLKNQMFVTSASGEYLDYIAMQRGLSRKQAKKAQGEIMFRITQPIDHTIIIPKGTVVATEDEVPMRFVTTEPEEITKGNTVVSIYAEAEQAGSRGNIKAGQAVVLVSAPSEIETASNPYDFEDGEDAESDMALRERIRRTFTSQSNGTNSAYYEQLALSVSGIEKAGVVPKVRGVGTVNLYVCGKDERVSDEVKAELQELVDRERELNVDVQVYHAGFTDYDLDVVVVPKSGYSLSEITEKLTNAFKEYISTIPIGGKLYLSSIGKYLLDTDCIENYEFDVYMHNMEVSGSQCFRAGEITITV